MKTYTNEKGETVIEFTFADWEEGLAFDTKAPYTNRTARNTQTGEVTNYNLSANEHAKIIEASKALYKKKAIARAVEIRDAFHKKLANSEAKETLLKQEIEKCEAILLPANTKAAVIFNNEHPIAGVPWNATHIAGIKMLYQKLIIDGNKDYSIVTHPNCQVKDEAGDFWHIETEALFKFHWYLKNFDLDAFNRKDPPFIHPSKKIPLNIFLEKSGLMDRLKKYGAPINPIHNFKMLMEARQEVYEKLKAEFVAECELNETPIDSDDWVLFNQLHWDNELTSANKWIKEQKDRKHPSAAILVQLNKYINYIKQQLAQPSTVEPMAKVTDTQTITSKPSFAPEHIDAIYQLLKDFFAIEEQGQLLEIITNGSALKKPLLFKDNGNRLADTFKQLIKADVITGCQQKELEQWILANFIYQYRGQSKTFTSRYLNDIISTNKDKCQKPIIEVRINPTRITKA